MKSKTNIFLFLMVCILAACSQMTAEDWLNSGTEKHQQGDYEGAIEDYKKALNMKGTYAVAHYAKGLSESELENYDEALNEFNTVLEIIPHYKNAYISRAFYVKERTGDLKGAYEDYTAAINLKEDDNDAYAYNNRGYVLLQLGDTLAALSDINSSLDLNPGNPYAYRNRAMVYIAMGKISQGCKDLNKAAELGFADQYGDEVSRLINEHCE